jgi:hypothetical protein
MEAIEKRIKYLKQELAIMHKENSWLVAAFKEELKRLEKKHGRKTSKVGSR